MGKERTRTATVPNTALDRTSYPFPASLGNPHPPQFPTTSLAGFMSQTPPQDTFKKQVQHVRAAYQKKRDATNLVPPTGRPVFEISVEVFDGTVCYTYWYEYDDRVQPYQHRLQCIRLAVIPGTLSEAILRLDRNLPELDTMNDYEIMGDEVRSLMRAPPPPDYEGDAEDVSTVLALLPEVEVNSNQHFCKKPKYTSEIRNLLACQGGSCPGQPKSAHIIQLLGKSANGELVFQKYKPHYVLASVHPLAVYKAWILQLIAGLRCLHSLSIVHRDLRIDNLIFSSDHSRLIICDLEGRWGNRLAPEVSRQPVLNAGWTQKSDIYDLGCLIKSMIYGNTPITNLVEWNIPSPLNAVVESCTRVLPEERLDLDELYAMVDKIEAN